MVFNDLFVKNRYLLEVLKFDLLKGARIIKCAEQGAMKNQLINNMYSNKELDKVFKDPEKENAEKYFLDIKHRITKGQKTSIGEKNFFCKCLKILELKGRTTEKVVTYKACENYWFKDKYLEYWHDLHGIKEHKTTFGQTITKNEIQSDLKKLEKYASDWHEIVNITNHSDEFLKNISKATRDDIEKEFNHLPEFNHLGFLNKNNEYKFRLKKLLLRSKYIYIATVEEFEKIKEETGSVFVKYSLNGVDLEFNSYSMIHTLNRHYAYSEKQVERDKSLHEKLIRPRRVMDFLKIVIEKIEKSGKYSAESIEKINFQYKSKPFTLYVNLKTKQIKGKGNVQYFRVQTFFPIGDQEELRRINMQYNLVKIDEVVSIYLEK